MMLALANFFAHFSVTLYNPHRILRVLSRKGYIWLGKLYRRLQLRRLKDYRRFRTGSLSAINIYQKYFWPYYDPQFFPEVDDPVDDNVLGDEFRFVPRHSTSLCNFAHYVLTGKSLDIPGTWHAKDWSELLHLHGYDRFYCYEPFYANSTVQQLIDLGYDYRKIELRTDRFYIGINPNIGEYGEVVWLERFEHIPFDASPSHCRDQAVVSTYRDCKPCLVYVNPKDYIWIQIGDYKRA